MSSNFERWWETDPINSSPVLPVLKEAFKELAKRGWDAALASDKNPLEIGQETCLHLDVEEVHDIVKCLHCGKLLPDT